MLCIQTYNGTEWEQSYLLTDIKMLLKDNASVLKNIYGYDICLHAKTTQEFIENTYAMAGYPSKDAYFEGECVLKRIGEVQTPTLLINSLDGNGCCAALVCKLF